MAKKEKKKWKYLILLLLAVFAISVMVIYKDKLSELGAIAPSGGNGPSGGVNTPGGSPNNNCVDSDGGRNYNIVGVISDATTSPTPDSCLSVNVLIEGYCDNNQAKWEYYTCPEPQICQAGKCMTPTPTPSPTPQYYCCESAPLYTESKGGIYALVPGGGSYTCQQDACPQYTFQVSGPYNAYATCMESCGTNVATACADIKYPTSQKDCDVGICPISGQTCTYQSPILYSSNKASFIVMYGSCACSGASCNVGTNDCYKACNREFGSTSSICYSGRCPLGYVASSTDTSCSQQYGQSGCDNCCCQYIMPT
jgi:hypothetical protein